MRLRVPAAPVLVLLLALFLLPACASRVDREALWDAGGLVHSKGWWSDCIRYNQLFARKFPDDPRAPHALLVEGSCHFYSGNFNSTISCCGWIESYYPNTSFHADALFLRGLAHVRIGSKHDMDQARRVFVSLIETFPKYEMCPVAQKVINGIDAGLTWEDMDVPPSPPPDPSI